MSKPIRFSKNLLSDAERQAALEHRTVPKQLEYWVSLGKLVAKNVRAEDSLALMQGFLKIRVEESDPTDFKMEDVLGELAADQRMGVLPNKVTASPFRYGYDPENPNQLVRIDAEGKRLIETGESH